MCVFRKHSAIDLKLKWCNAILCTMEVHLMWKRRRHTIRGGTSVILTLCYLFDWLCRRIGISIYLFLSLMPTRVPADLDERRMINHADWGSPSMCPYANVPNRWCWCMLWMVNICETYTKLQPEGLLRSAGQVNGCFAESLIRIIVTSCARCTFATE